MIGVKLKTKKGDTMNKKFWASAIALIAVAGVATFIGCGGEQKPVEDKTPPPQANPVAITITGSDTMVHLVNAWAEAYMKSNPNVLLTVNGGGSGVGIAALINSTTDIASASREMKQKEFDDAKAAGNEAIENAVALDGISVVVHPSNPINELTTEQLKDIFTGKKTNWKDFGGPDKKISILSRESSSGTYQFFQEHVLKKENYAQSAKLMPATSAIIESTSQDATSIGYVGLGYALEAGSKIKIISVKADAKSPAVMPSETTVKDKSYPIARALYLYTKANSSTDVTNFINFCLSPAGQAIVKEVGYITIL